MTGDGKKSTDLTPPKRKTTKKEKLFIKEEVKKVMKK